MARIFWDTNLFIYLLENNPTFMPYVENLRVRMLTRNDQLLTSTITLGEVLIKPTQAGDAERDGNGRGGGRVAGALIA